MANRGKLIVLEGLDGSGKTTQAQLLSRRIQETAGGEVLVTCEPGDSPPGRILREDNRGEVHLCRETAALLYAADRYEHVTGVMLPHLEAGGHVVCDRYYLSNLAYQSLHCRFEDILAYNRAALELCRADRTVFLDVSPEDCAARRAGSREREELYERVELAKSIRENYLTAFARLRDREQVLVVDGAGDAGAVLDRYWPVLLREVFG